MCKRGIQFRVSAVLLSNYHRPGPELTYRAQERPNWVAGTKGSSGKQINFVEALPPNYPGNLPTRKMPDIMDVDGIVAAL